MNLNGFSYKLIKAVLRLVVISGLGMLNNEFTRERERERERERDILKNTYNEKLTCN